MKKLLLLLAAFQLMAFSCDTEICIEGPENTCAVTNPVEDLPWLQEKIGGLQQSDPSVAPYFYITQALYENKTVFIFENCCPHCTTVVPVYDCQGQQLFLAHERTDFQQKAKNSRLIWQPENFACR
ncbi:hypothetical protein BH24BAC1_BH24BAC1_33250 [soil metagenome]